MSSVLRNAGGAFWANIADEVTQLSEVSAIAPLVQATNSIVRFQTSAVGPGSEHNLLRNTPNVIMDDAGNVNAFNSMTMTESASNPGTADTIWVKSSDHNLYFGASQLSGLGGGDVTGPGSSNNGAVTLFNGTTGKVIEDSGTYLASDTFSNLALSNTPIASLTGRSASILIGENAGNSSSAGTTTSCIAIGTDTLSLAALPNFDIAIGTEALLDTQGNECIAIGAFALPGPGTDGCIAIGYQSQRNLGSVPTANISIGRNSMLACTTSNSDICIGDRCCDTATTINEATVISGANCCQNMTQVNNCTIVGSNVANACTVSVSNFNSNVFVGDNIASTATDLTNVTNNTCVGSGAGQNLSAGATNNVLLGQGCGSALTTESNVIALGAGEPGIIGQSNIMLLGNSTIASSYIAGVYSSPTSSDTNIVRIDSNNKLYSTASNVFLSMGSIYNNSTAVIPLTINVPAVINGAVTFRGDGSSPFSSSGPGQLKYNGANIRTGLINYSIQGIMNSLGNTGELTFQLYQNASPVVGTVSSSYADNTYFAQVANSSVVSFNTNDIFTLYVTNTSTSDSFFLTNLSLSIMCMSS